MSAHILEMKPVSSVASVLRFVTGPLKIPAWSVVLLAATAGVYGYVSGRKNPVHHYVPYVGYPLVLDTTTGKACYATTPKPSDDGASYGADGSASSPDAGQPSGPPIPLCGK